MAAEKGGHRGRVVLLAGGVGASKLAQGLARAVGPGELTIISNVGDDEEVYGLHVSPDMDIMTYALAGLVDERKGWGIRGDTFHCDEFLRRLGESPWLLLGDRDLAVNVLRTTLLKRGSRLSEAASRISSALGLSHRILPVTDGRLTTMLETDRGDMSFEEFFVREKQSPEVRGVHYSGSAYAEPAPGVMESLEGASAIVFAPSNPIASIGPILSVKKVRCALLRSAAPRVAVSPIIAGRTVRGPADKMLKALGYEATAAGVAEFYLGLVDLMVIDSKDAGLKGKVKGLGMEVLVERTMMTSLDAKVRLAKAVLRAAGIT
jgi:LPPG:FO 2-phospho-L-lactate transferase